MSEKAKELGVPRTVGQLRKKLEKFSDDTEFGFRNGPLERLVACNYGGETAVLFDNREPTAPYERVVELEAEIRRLREELANAYRGECPACGGSGGVAVTVPAHHPMCDGSCEHCPVPEQELEPCQMCGAGGTVLILPAPPKEDA